MTQQSDEDTAIAITDSQQQPGEDTPQAIVLRDDKGRFLPGNPPPAHAIQDRTQAVALANRRWRLARQAAAEGMAAALPPLDHVAVGHVTEYDAWRMVVEKQTRLAMDTVQGHASTRAAEFVGKAAGLHLDGGQAAGGQPAAGPVQLLTEAAYLRLLAAIAARLAGVA